MIRQRISQIRALMGIAHGSRALGGPLQASLALTNRCNVRCIHCYFYSPYLDKPALHRVRRARMENAEEPNAEELKGLQGLDMDPRRAREVVDELLRMGTRRFQISGNGEVFLYPEALELFARMKRAGGRCHVNTNGTLLKRDVADELIRMGFDELRITVMAGSPETYARTHPGFAGRTFHLIRDNIGYLSERKAALGVGRPHITLVYIVERQNFDGLLDYARFASEVGADCVLFKPVDDIGDAGLSNVVPTGEEAAHVRASLPEVKAHLDSNGIRNNVEHFRSVFRRQLDTSALHREIPCYYGWLSVMVEPDGDVLPCCRCYSPLGNVFDSSMAAIWRGEAYRAFRRKALGLPRRGAPVDGCDCFSCVHYTANIRVYRALHPLKSRALLGRLAGDIPAADMEES